eukprot:TRINITY_DN5568_c0_g1_i2.p1 TRINITY_DN5568_c0_g1~~TRINITY_DN5568_c0_g1_i2.p1  ORF type:complete len:248 (+),score=38.63 TRINITY_DN5568_c0_g1_i2:118-861(+)
MMYNNGGSTSYVAQGFDSRDAGQPHLSDIPIPRRFFSKNVATAADESRVTSSTCFDSFNSRGTSLPDEAFGGSDAPQDGLGEMCSSTTLMIKNVPVTYTEEMFQQELDESEFRSSYVSMRMPKRRGGKSNRGYVFVQFSSSEAANMFATAWRGRRLSLFPDSTSMRRRPLAISKAHREGFEEFDDEEPHMPRQNLVESFNNGLSTYDEWARSRNADGRQQFALVGDFVGGMNRETPFRFTSSYPAFQ